MFEKHKSNETAIKTWYAFIMFASALYVDSIGSMRAQQHDHQNIPFVSHTGNNCVLRKLIEQKYYLKTIININ